MNSGYSILVVLCTFRRPVELVKALDSLLAAIASCNEASCRAVVVDNDSSPSAMEIVNSHAGVHYVHEPRPGIAQARNRGIDQLIDEDFVAFFDDDEVVSTDWLNELVLAAKTYSADVVAGPVVTSFPSGAPAWVTNGGFLQRRRLTTGSSVPFPATNNVLIRVEALRAVAAGGAVFDETFSISGGSDTELFWRMGRLGLSMIWADRAEVFEDMPAERLTLKWVLRRGLRGGNVYGRLLLREKSKLGVLWYGGVRAAVGLILTLSTLIRRRSVERHPLSQLTFGSGIFASALGIRIHEYTRVS